MTNNLKHNNELKRHKHIAYCICHPNHTAIFIQMTRDDRLLYNVLRQGCTSNIMTVSHRGAR